MGETGIVGCSLVTSLLFKALAQFRDSFGVDLTTLDEAHDQFFARSAEHAIDEIAQGVAGCVGFGDGSSVFEGAPFELALQLALAMQDVEHGLHGGVGEPLLEAFLHIFHAAGAV